MTLDTKEQELQKLKWRCRRGIKELDLIFTNFLESHYPLSVKQTQLTESLLDVNDLDLYDWFTGKSEPTESELSEHIQLIRSCTKKE
ncbi:MAG: hypothetical protein CBC29_09610 [Methylococcaceae bacterium TMED69]|nr:MAG: hypothetical protein CBC29_09610 [Methylococcaceae bacterium TMED69]